MKNLTGLFLGLALTLALVPSGAEAASNIYPTTYTYPAVYQYQYQPNQQQVDYLNYLYRLVAQLQQQLQAQKQTNYYYPTPYQYNYSYGPGNYGPYDEVIVVGKPRSGSSNSNDDEPDADTDTARNVTDDSAELRGTVDMNYFDSGHVFFVYGEDDNQVEDVENDYDEYRDIDEDGDDLQKVSVDSDLDGDASYRAQVYGLDNRTDIYFQICVEYDDDDNDPVITCGGLQDFETDN